MRSTYLMITVLGSLLLSVTVASAQTAPASEETAPRTDPQPEALPEAQPIAPAPGVRPATVSPNVAPQVPTCGAGGIQGVYPAEAQTSVWLVCEDIRRRSGVPAAISPTDPSPVYRVGLLRLGQSVIMTVHVEAPVGTIRDSRQLQLASIEEVPVAAPRLVEALWLGAPVASTRGVATLVGQETREYKKEHGEFLYGGGLAGMVLAGSGAAVLPGIDLRAGYESERFGIGLGFRFGSQGDYNAERSANYSGFSVGGRYFLSDGNTGAFVGGGLTYSSIELDRNEPDRYESLDGSGIGAYGEVGVELLRLHSSRLAFDLRFETPFYQLAENGYSPTVYDSATDSYVSQPRSDEKSYVVPIMVGLAYTF
jgi:hypothetical protein